MFIASISPKTPKPTRSSNSTFMRHSHGDLSGNVFNQRRILLYKSIAYFWIPVFLVKGPESSSSVFPCNAVSAISYPSWSRFIIVFTALATSPGFWGLPKYIHLRLPSSGRRFLVGFGTPAGIEGIAEGVPDWEDHLALQPNLPLPRLRHRKQKHQVPMKWKPEFPQQNRHLRKRDHQLRRQYRIFFPRSHHLSRVISNASPRAFLRLILSACILVHRFFILRDKLRKQCSSQESYPHSQAGKNKPGQEGPDNNTQKANPAYKSD